MCLAVPMKIIKIDGHRAVAESHGVETVVDISLYPDVQIDDKVIVHAGFIIEKLDEEAAKEIEETWELYLRSLEEEDQKH